jgi:hypothetical protein
MARLCGRVATAALIGCALIGSGVGAAQQLDARYREYSERIGNAHSMNEGFQVVAAFLAGLKDSHTYFSPRFG